MTGKIPEGYKLAEEVDESVYLADKYENWTVSDLIEFLNECNPDAPVFLLGMRDEEGDTIQPLEFLTGSNEMVTLA